MRLSILHRSLLFDYYPGSPCPDRHRLRVTIPEIGLLKRGLVNQGKHGDNPHIVLLEDRSSVKMLARTPKSLHEELIEKAKEEGVSLNQLVVYLLSVGIGRSKAA